MTAESYDRLAEEYARRIFGELEDKLLDRELLDRFAAEVRGRGVVCDLGCGPGHVARYLAERGMDVMGMDLSAGMVRKARELNPGIPFAVGDMLALPVETGAWAGIAAFYSIIHVVCEKVVDALREMARALMPGGLLLLAFHEGEEVRHFDELWEIPVNLDFHFYTGEEMCGWLSDAGFTVDEVIRREPYPEVEAQTRRAYIFARKLAGQRDLFGDCSA